MSGRHGELPGPGVRDGSLGSMTNRVQAAVTAVLIGYQEELDSDPLLRTVVVEVRVKPDGNIRAVVLRRESEASVT